MDAVEVARHQAAQLHQRALDQGADPWQPLEMVLEEVVRQGFAAEPIAKGATQLRNAQAKFDPSLGLILYSDAGSDFERAFLIAHELGHALLGDVEGGCDPDPERSSEPAPEGEERVVAHGPRQRREVQMDLFARELLVPRPFVRRCHLEANMTGEAIAERMGAPLGVVYQQMLDALLLPDLQEKPRIDRAKPLNAEQVKAARHTGGAFLLEAGPGTGKTQTLTARVTHLLSRGVDPRRVLVLTYSNRAAGELTERVAGPSGDALAAMWIGTFHGFGLEVLHTFGDRIHCGRKPTLLDRAGAIALLEDELPRLGFRHHRDLYDPTLVVADMLSAISRAQDEMCDPSRYADLAQRMREGAEQRDGDGREKALEAAERASEVAVLYARYEDLKRARGLVDFGDLVMLAVNLLETDEVVSAHYRGRYSHVLVDEYQDVNRASVRMLKALKPGGTGLWAVGDAHQSIYRFRGASSRNMARFTSDFAQATQGELSVNYRSSEEIVDLFNHFGAGMIRVHGEDDPEARHHTALTADLGPSGIAPELVVTGDKSTTAPMIAERIEADRQAGGAYGDHAVLVSGNDRLADIARELEALGIPVLFLGSLFERSEIKDLLCLLSVATDPWAAGLLRLACMPEFRMDLASVVEAQTALKARPRDSVWPLLDPDTATTLSPSGAKGLRALAYCLKGVRYESDPWEVLARILFDRTRIAARHARGKSAADRTCAIAIWQFMNFVKSARGRERPAIPALLARVRRLLRASDERELRHLPAAASGIDAVRLMTIHGAKGLEFPVVHLPGLNANTMPKAPHLGRPACPPPEGMIEHARGSIENELGISFDEEQECLLYVALSRAQRKLHLYRCSVQKNGKTVRPESSFVGRLGAGLVQRTETPTRRLPASADSAAVPVRHVGDIRMAAWRLATYRRCPRRFLYMHVLRTGGASEKTPYVRVHDIVREVCRAATAMPAFPDEAELQHITREACSVTELLAHGYYQDFVQLAVDLVTFYGKERREVKPATVTAIEVPHENDVILVDVHDLVHDGDNLVVWLVQTGHARKDADDRFDFRAAAVAAMTTLPNARAESLSLADRTKRTIVTKKGAEANFLKMAGEIFKSVRGGIFPKLDDPGPRACGNCPAFLVCDALPEGEVEVKI